MAEATEETKTKADPNRPYNVYRPVSINLTDGEALQALANEIGSAEFDVLVHVGEVNGDSPRKAISNLGADKDLEGDFVVIAKTAQTLFVNVTSAVKRVVSIG